MKLWQESTHVELQKKQLFSTKNKPLIRDFNAFLFIDHLLDENGQIMSLRHRELDIRGVQFHPESVLTPSGKEIIKNWINS